MKLGLLVFAFTISSTVFADLKEDLCKSSRVLISRGEAMQKAVVASLPENKKDGESNFTPEEELKVKMVFCYSLGTITASIDERFKGLNLNGEVSKSTEQKLAEVIEKSDALSGFCGLESESKKKIGYGDAHETMDTLFSLVNLFTRNDTGIVSEVCSK